jgi:hypothetical protein
MNAPTAAMSSPSGLLELLRSGRKAGPPVTRKPLRVKHALATPILAATARKLADITIRLNGTQPLACSSTLGLGVDRANADPEQLNRRPSVKTNVQFSDELTAARGLADVDLAEQLTDVT